MEPFMGACWAGIVGRVGGADMDMELGKGGSWFIS